MEKGRSSSDLTPEEWLRVVMEIPDPEPSDASPSAEEDPVLLYRETEARGVVARVRAALGVALATARSGMDLASRLVTWMAARFPRRRDAPREPVGHSVAISESAGGSEAPAPMVLAEVPAEDAPPTGRRPSAAPPPPSPPATAPRGGGGRDLTLAPTGARWSGDGGTAVVARRPWSPMESVLAFSWSSIPTWAIAGAVVAIWAVVGLVFWLPVLIGATVRFSVAHLDGMLDDRVPAGAGRTLRSAISFYARGFSSALDVARGSNAGLSAGYTDQRADPTVLAPGRLLRAVVWAVLAWYPVLLITGVVEWPPGGVPEWTLTQPWELAGVVRDGFVTAVGEVMSAAARLQGNGAPVP